MHTRTAKTIEDVQNVTDFLEGETWDHARAFLEAAPDDPNADHLRWLEEDGRPVACVQVFVHQYPIGRAQMGLCLPEYPFVPPELRGRGYFKQLMADLMQWLRENGYPLAYDHGRKGLYTGRGYAPCFHHCMALLRTTDALRLAVPAAAKPAVQADVEEHSDLLRGPNPLGRGLMTRDETWVPKPEWTRVVHAPDGTGLRGFVIAGPVYRPGGAWRSGLVDVRKGEALTITDAWAADCPTAAVLLKTVAVEAQSAGVEWIKLNCRRDDPVARMAVLTGGELRWSAGQERDWTDDGEDVDAFCVTDLRVCMEQMLPEFQDRREAFTRDAPASMRLSMDDETVGLWLDGEVALLNGEASAAPEVRLSRKAMTQAVMGYATPAELACLHEGCDIPPECTAAVDVLFPAREPHLIHESMTFAKPEQLGLVP